MIVSIICLKRKEKQTLKVIPQKPKLLLIIKIFENSEISYAIEMMHVPSEITHLYYLKCKCNG